jgi:hypothetical protein
VSALAYTVSELSARSPDRGEREFAEFVEDIRVNGQLVPIWLRGDEVIDGRKRLAACQRLGIEPKVMNLDPSQDAERVARALNVLRTHYTPSQRAIFAAERANCPPGRRWVNSANLPSNVTVAEAAQEVGVSPTAVVQARRVIAAADPAVTAAVKAGHLTIHAANQLVDAVPERDEQPAVVALAIEANKGKTRHTPVAKVLDGIDPRRDRSIPHPKQEQFALAVQKLEVGAELVTQHVGAASQDIRRNDFLTSLREVRTAISRAINALEAA